jgi:hypothetical protein
MRESRTYGSVRGALSNGCPYRVTACCGAENPFTLLRHCENKRSNIGRTFDLNQCHSKRCTRKLQMRADNRESIAFIKQELLDSAGVCEQVANNIEDRWASGRRHPYLKYCR